MDGEPGRREPRPCSLHSSPGSLCDRDCPILHTGRVVPGGRASFSSGCGPGADRRQDDKTLSPEESGCGPAGPLQAAGGPGTLFGVSGRPLDGVGRFPGGRRRFRKGSGHLSRHGSGGAGDAVGQSGRLL